MIKKTYFCAMAIKNLFENQKFSWIDAEQPTKENLENLQERFGIEKLFLEDAVESEHLPKYEEVPGVKFYLTRESRDTETSTPNIISEISTKLAIFIVGRHLITIHRLPTPIIEQVLQEIRNPKFRTTINIDKVALKLGKKILLTFNEEQERVSDELDAIESKIFLSKMNDTLQIKNLYQIKRKAALNMRVLNLSTDWVKNFQQLSLSKIEVNDLIELQKDILNNFEHLSQQANNLMGLHLALSDQRNNEAMKMLSKYSIYFLPITFLAGVYGMNFDRMPELAFPYGYYITLSVMAIIVICTFIYLRKKRF